MNTQHYKTIALVMMLAGVLAVACSIPFIGGGAGEDLSATKTSVAQTVISELANQSSQEEATQEVVTEVPTETEAPEPTAAVTPTIHHVVTPDKPDGSLTSLTDISTVEMADEKNAIGDNFIVNLFERPYTAGEMNYYGYVDIIFSSLMVGPKWVYTSIQVQNELPDQADAFYSVEFDLDIDGRGDILVTAALPTGTDWTTNGVYVYKDTDKDVGAERPLFSDAPVEGQNGFDEVVFAEGVANDPDLAWVRRDPEEKDHVQIAFKLSVLEGDGEFLWGVWADGSGQSPTSYDLNDQYTQEEAGVPIVDDADYPLKALALLDSTCRSWFGFEPTGSEPGICYIPKAEGGSGMGWCPQYLNRYVDCVRQCYRVCPSNAQYCIRCRLP